ncbi:unnamed protein product [Pleuronectes platessa]|uniref:Uncharacterized protein n=1 Tax=Pleuronectes platessa TaxID=8262 RepID=A0A9N7UE31_PLEPL|nr:unnamed protein product [Pleuronectes platessa]
MLGAVGISVSTRRGDDSGSTLISTSTDVSACSRTLKANAWPLNLHAPRGVFVFLIKGSSSLDDLPPHLDGVDGRDWCCGSSGRSRDFGFGPQALMSDTPQGPFHSQSGVERVERPFNRSHLKRGNAHGPKSGYLAL